MDIVVVGNSRVEVTNDVSLFEYRYRSSLSAGRQSRIGYRRYVALRYLFHFPTSLPLYLLGHQDLFVSYDLAGSRGLGFYTAAAFLLAGASLLIIVGRKASGPEGLDQAVEKLNELSYNREKVRGQVIAIPADVSKYSEILRLRNVLTSQHGVDHIDILVANAAATWGGPFETTPDWSSAKILDLNVRSVFGLVQVFQSLLEKGASQRDPSRVIIVSSTAGRTVQHVEQNGTDCPG